MNFFGGEFFGGGFYGLNVTVRGGKGDNQGRRIVKPTGLPPYREPRIEQRVREAREIHQEVAREVLKLPVKKEITQMSLVEIDLEIGQRLREKLQKEDEEIMLMLLVAAAG